MLIVRMANMALKRTERPTIEALASGAFVEDNQLDFKRQLNLEREEGRHRFIEDVAAFLNRGAATILVGVDESEGRFAGFRPLQGDRDALGLQVLNILHDGISPPPLDIRVHALDVDEGFILDIEIPAHPGGPFQVKHNGAFLRRAGPKNRPLSRAELTSYLVEEKQWLDAVATQTREESEKLDASGRMSERGCVLIFGILPRAHFDPHFPSFSQNGPWRSYAPSFEDRARVLFKGHDGGHEAFALGGDGKGGSRVLVRDDWFIHGWIAHPLWVQPGEERLSLFEFKKDLLPAFLGELDDFLDKNEIEGPFAVTMELAFLKRNEGLGRFFHDNERVRMLRPRFVQCMSEIGEPFVELVHRSTIYA
jgi:hypothetical protein